MTVLFTIDIKRFPDQGFPDRRLPVATWRADLVVNGDVSGGSVQLRARFRQSPDPFSALAFSVEHIAAQSTNNGNVTLGFQTSGFDQLFQRGIGLSNELTGALIDGGQLDLPWFIGVVKPANNALITLTYDNTNGATYTGTLAGYMWGQRSISAPGGYGRPIQGRWRP